MTARRAFALLLLLPLTAAYGATQTGTVVDGAGRPLADAEIRLELRRTADGQSAREDRSLEPPRQARTDARGGFRFAGLCSGCDYAVRAARSGFAPEILMFTTPRQGGATPALRLALRPGRTAFGTVVDEAGRPAAGIAVELVREERIPFGGVLGEAGPYRAVTGPEGRFEIPDLPAGQATLGITRPGFPLSWVRRLQIPEGAGRTDLGRLELQAGRTITGRALDPQGQPLADVAVWVARVADSALQATWKRQIEAGPQAVTGPDGRFSIPHVEKQARLVLCRAGYQSARPTESGDVKLQPVVRVPRARIAGRVVTASGEPVAGARVAFELMIGCGYRLIQFDPCPPEEAPPSPQPVSGPDGRFVLEVEGSGTRRIWTQPAGFIRAMSPEIRYGPDEKPFVELVVDRGAVVTGRIFTLQGKPAAGAEVFIEGNVRAVTGADGAFRLEGVEPGRRSLTASHRELGQAARRVDVAPGGARQDLTLDGQGVREIRGRVLGPDGRPLPAVRVWIVCPGCQEAVWSAGDGSFTLALDERRHKEVHAERAGFLSRSVPLPPGNEPVEGLEIRLERGIVLTGRVLDAEPRHRPPVPERFREQLLRISVSATPAEGGGWQQAFVEADGTYRFESLSPGEWKVMVNALDRRHMEQVVLEPGMGEAVLDLRLSPAHEIRGRIVDEEGRPVRGQLQIFAEGLSPDSSAISSTGSREDGFFIAWAQEGVYKLRATAPGLAPATSTLHVDGPLSGLEIRLEDGVVLRGRVLGIVPGNMTMVSTRGVFPPLSVRIDPDGTYRLTGLGPGSWRIEATHQDPDGSVRRLPFSVNIAPGSPEVIRDVDLAVGDFALSGRLLSRNEEPVSANLRIVRTDEVEIRWNGVISPDGDFRVPGLAPGRYRIEVTDPRSGELVLEREVEMDGDLELTSDSFPPRPRPGGR